MDHAGLRLPTGLEEGGAEWPLRRGDEFPCHDEHLGRFGGSPRVVGVPDSRITTVDRGGPADLHHEG
jgi:hypothetical protein